MCRIQTLCKKSKGENKFYRRLFSFSVQLRENEWEWKRSEFFCTQKCTDFRNSDFSGLHCTKKYRNIFILARVSCLSTLFFSRSYSMNTMHTIYSFYSSNSLKHLLFELPYHYRQPFFSCGFFYCTLCAKSMKMRSFNQLNRVCCPVWIIFIHHQKYIYFQFNFSLKQIQEKNKKQYQNMR